MTEQHLHIVCLDVPYPVDYGGVFDLFYKIKSLAEAGIKIHLHCFEYGRGQQPELNKYCAEVTYYQRNKGLIGLSWKTPYIVQSRANPSLIYNLQKDDYPILMEGIHCTYFAANGMLPKERCFIRLHNVEFQYYGQLAATSSLGWKKLYYNWESRLLKKYEASLKDSGSFWTVSEKDLEVFQKELGYKSVDYLPLFLPPFEPEWQGDKGQFCLYHGNLSVPENEHAATWLLENIFHKLELPLVIAGKNPSPKLEKLAHTHTHTCLVANPGEEEMLELIKKAQVNILPSFNNTGIKLKLINALTHGRHCLVNTAGVEGSTLEKCCVIADSTQEMEREIQRLFEMPFNFLEFTERKNHLTRLFNNSWNAEQLIRWIYKKEPTVPGEISKRLRQQK